MASSYSEELKRAVEHMHSGTTTFIESAPVKETFEGKTVWKSIVHEYRSGKAAKLGICSN